VVVAALEEPTSIYSLDLSGNNVDASSAPLIGEVVRENSTLVSLNLNGYSEGERMRAEGMLALMNVLAINQTLTSLDLASHGLMNSCCLSLARCLLHTSVSIISLRGNHIGSRGGMGLASALADLSSALVEMKSTRYVAIDIRENPLEEDAVEELSRVSAASPLLAAFPSHLRRLGKNQWWDPSPVHPRTLRDSLYVHKHHQIEVLCEIATGVL
jgi:Ran GTPase-activating protein (RanGAP) involved in mRNA processing and transport